MPILIHRTWAIASWSCSNGKEMFQEVYCGYKVVVLLNLNILLSDFLPVVTGFRLKSEPKNGIYGVNRVFNNIERRRFVHFFAMVLSPMQTGATLLASNSNIDGC